MHTLLPALAALNRQFMLGDTLLVTPVLEEGASKVEGYFPQGVWYSVWDRHDAVDARCGPGTLCIGPPGLLRALHGASSCFGPHINELVLSVCQHVSDVRGEHLAAQC